LWGEFGGVIAQTALVDNTVLNDKKSHDAGFAIFGWLGEEGKPTGHVAAVCRAAANSPRIVVRTKRKLNATAKHFSVSVMMS